MGRTAIVLLILGVLVLLRLEIWHWGTNMLWMPRRGISATDLYRLQQAINNSDPDQCSQIDSRVVFLTLHPGRQIVRLASQCYYELAINLRRPELCGRLSPVYTILLNGGGVNPQNCVRDVARWAGKKQFSPPTLTQEMLNRVELPSPDLWDSPKETYQLHPPGNNVERKNWGKDWDGHS